MKQYKYILWDLDGTVVNTFEGVSKSLKLVFDHFGSDIAEEEYYNFIGPPLRDSFPEYAGIPKERVEEAITIFRDRYNTIGVFECSLFPDVRETMEALHDAGYIQVISSSKMEERCGDIMRKFNLTEFLDEIVGASEDGRIDSKIEVLNETFRRLVRDYPDFAVEDAVLIGDTKYDAAGAREAGIDCVGISYGFGSREDLLTHGAVAVFEDLRSLSEELFLK